VRSGNSSADAGPTIAPQRVHHPLEPKGAPVGEWIPPAAHSVDRWRVLLGDASGFSGDLGPLRLTLTADDLKLAFELVSAQRLAQQVLRERVERRGGGGGQELVRAFVGVRGGRLRMSDRFICTALAPATSNTAAGPRFSRD
jgi:hypothetical protein